MAHPIFGVIYIQGDISRQRAPKGQLSTAQGTALGIRYLRTMRPAKGSSNVPLFFLQLPLLLYLQMKRKKRKFLSFCIPLLNLHW